AFAQMFVDEAQICSRMVHPNIVSVLDFDRDAEGRLFLVMELVEGKDLDALNATGLLPFPVVIYTLSEMLRGLGYAHDLPAGTDMRGIVHRDVSPHNVLLSWEGAVKVSDFGIAKAKAASEATASVFIKGKPAYMSPEQANGQALDGRSDLFAVGIMLWEMLVGRRLFVGEDTRATLAAVLFGQVPRPRTLRSDVPKDLEKVVMKMLERDVNARYATAEDAIADLLDCNDAPKGGRDVLMRTLGERFPNEVRVRQSMVRGGRASIPPIHAAPTIAAPAAGTRPTGASGTPPPVASLGMAMAAPTLTMSSGKLGPKTRLAIVGSITLVVAAISFAIIYGVTRHHGPAIQPDGSVASSTVPAFDAARPPPDVAVDAPPDAPPPDAPADATHSVPADAPKKDASDHQAPHPDKYGLLVVHGDPSLTVFIDGVRMRDTPFEQKLRVGKHNIRLTNTEFGYDEPIGITITENKTTTIDRIGWKH
ncbi:MAG TPA: serine/threonine-protein kinase, partial [Kofleriaceae bacterium]|nr:serine/threonine-protein kinase [Kofleriaceae bacterium]